MSYGEGYYGEGYYGEDVDDTSASAAVAVSVPVQGRDFKIVPSEGQGQMSFEKATDIMNNIYLSLMINKGAFFFNPDFGSRLYTLIRAKNTPQTAARAVDYCKEALQWLLDIGRATKINVYSERDMLQDLHRLKLLIEVTQADGRTVTFDTFLEVV